MTGVSALDRLGMTIVESSHVRSGQVLLLPGQGIVRTDGTLVIGTRDWTEVERARWEAKQIVHRGMVDVLEWLGEPSIADVPPPDGFKIVASLRAQTVTSAP